MKNRIQPDEILSQFRKAPSYTMKLAELCASIYQASKESYSKTTIYDNLQKLVVKGLIKQNEEGTYSLVEKWPAGTEWAKKYLELFQTVNEKDIRIILEDDQIKVIGNLPEDSQPLFLEFKKQIKELQKYNIVHVINKQIMLSYKSSYVLNICPVCLKKVETNRPFLIGVFYNLEQEDEIKHLVRLHQECAYSLLSASDSNKVKNRKLHAKENLEFKIENACQSCGLPLSVVGIFEEFHINQDDENCLLIQEIAKELYGNVRSLYWGFWHSVFVENKDYEIDFRLVTEYKGHLYHPQCAKRYSS